VNADQHFALILVVVFGVVMPLALAVGIPAGKAWARRLEAGGRSQDEGGTGAELQELRSRVAELEERLDFTERVLATQRESPQLGAGDA
jgi:Tfp pilus assembly protein PilO